MEVIFSQVFIVTLLAAGVRTAIPILLAATGEMFAERSGFLNIGLEGQMLMGAFISFVVGYFTNNLWFALLMGMMGGIFMAMIISCACITFKAQQIVAGITLNMFSLGATTFVYRAIFGITTTPPQANVAGTDEIAIPLLSQIPVLGEVLFTQNFMFYLALVLVVCSQIFLFSTTVGLRLRSVGEYPRAAETMGVNATKVRYLSMVACGAFAGLAGSYLSLVSLNRFIDNITAGRGFIALAIVIFGRWKPVPILIVSIVFGTLDALQLRLQAVGFDVPYQFMLMLPYLLTVILMAATSKRSKGPAAIGVNYDREKI